MIWFVLAFALGWVVGRVSERSRRRDPIDVISWVRRGKR